MCASHYIESIIPSETIKVAFDLLQFLSEGNLFVLIPETEMTSLKGQCNEEGDFKAETVELWMFSSPHLKVEAGTNDVAKLSKPKREIFKINNFKPGSSDIHKHITHIDSHYEGLVPYWVQSLLLYVCLVDFVI